MSIKDSAITNQRDPIAQGPQDYDHARILLRHANAAPIPTRQELIGDTYSMLSDQELRFLYGAARTWTQGWGHIVELGTYLGGSTLALGRGLIENKRATEGHTRIETFDRLELQPNPAAGVDEASDPLAMWQRNTTPVAPYVDLTVGDLSSYSRSTDAPPVEVLFVDVVKGPSTISPVMNEFASSCRPGSLIIQQDYFHWASPWVVYAMEIVKPWTSFVGHVSKMSAVFLVTKTFDHQLLPCDWVGEVEHDEAVEMIDIAASRFDGALRGSLRVSAARLECERDPERALALLDTIEREHPRSPRVRRYSRKLRSVASNQ